MAQGDAYELAKAEEATLGFVISRSKNSNVVCYCVNRTEDGAIDEANPLNIFWIMYENEGNPREGLNLIERNTAYGASATAVGDGRFEAHVASINDRVVVFFIGEDNDVWATTTINGVENMRLLRVFVNATSNWVGLPTVNYVEIFGVNPETGEAVYEKKIP
mmetsp:Transcript_16783/g.33477  ORF Transcript_16783/g.33477 Transcript_16783/m.33477 type:complete len:162 (-) Transcript_16783:26-511(-)